MRLNDLSHQVAIAVLALLFATSALGADADAGKAKTATCAACHGAAGVATIPDYPNLACQNEKYLAISIKAYKDGSRDNAIMKPMVAQLSDEDVANIAAYYAGLPCKS